MFNQPQWDISTTSLEEDVHFAPCFGVKRHKITPDNEIPYFFSDLILVHSFIFFDNSILCIATLSR